MRQVTLRLPDDLGDRLKQAAASQQRSVNSYVSAVLAAAVDPDLAGDEAARTRERLERAGLLASSDSRGRQRPPDEAVDAARARAGRGRSLSDLVSEGRG